MSGYRDWETGASTESLSAAFSAQKAGQLVADALVAEGVLPIYHAEIFAHVPSGYILDRIVAGTDAQDLAWTLRVLAIQHGIIPNTRRSES